MKAQKQHESHWAVHGGDSLVTHGVDSLMTHSVKHVPEEGGCHASL
jgi:hypothetical protein